MALLFLSISTLLFLSISTFLFFPISPVLFLRYDNFHGHLLVSEGNNDNASSKDSEDDEDFSDPRLESEDDEEALPVFLYKPQTTEKMGDWEKHTKVTACIYSS